MLYQIILLLIKVIVGTSLGLLGVYNTGMKKNKIKKMRIFDQFTTEAQNTILMSCIAYAKGEIAEFNLPPTTDIISLAVQYDTMYFTTIIDFNGIDTNNIPTFVGPRPIKRPL